MTDGTNEIVIYGPASGDVYDHMHSVIPGQTVNVKGMYLGWYNNPQFTLMDVNELELIPASDEVKVDHDISLVNLPSTVDAEGLTLPAIGENGSTITWVSSDTSIIGHDGVIVAQPEEATNVTFTATFMLNEITKTKTYEVMVLKTGSASPETVTVQRSGSSITTAIPNGNINEYLTITQTSGGTNDVVVMWDGSDADTKSIFNNSANETRLYVGGKLTFSVPGAKITKIEWTSSRNNGITVNGTASTDLNGSMEFVDGVDEVVIIATGAQFRSGTYTITYQV